MNDKFIILFDTDDGQKEIQCTAEQLERIKTAIQNLHGKFAINTICKIN